MQAPAGSLALPLTLMLTAQDCGENQFFTQNDPADPEDDECVDIRVPPPLNMVALGDSGKTAKQNALYDAFLYGCEDLGEDGTLYKPINGDQCAFDAGSGDSRCSADKAKCLQAINDGKYGQPYDQDGDSSTQDETYVFSNGVWSRYFEGIGPTAIMKYLKNADETFKDIETRYNEGKLRCLAGTHTNFSVDLNTVGSVDYGLSDWPLACYLGDYSSLGYEGGVFYYASIPPPDRSVRQFMKVKDDGTEMEVWNVFGHPGNGGSTGINHFKSVEHPDGSKNFYMNPMGAGLGASCGTYLAFHTASDGTTTHMYFKINNHETGGYPNVDCYNYAASPNPTRSQLELEVCLDETFSEVTLSNCTDDAGLDLDNYTAAGMELFEEILDGSGITVPGHDNNIGTTLSDTTFTYQKEDGTTASVTLTHSGSGNVEAPMHAGYISLLGTHDGTQARWHRTGSTPEDIAFEIEDLWPGNHPVAIQDPLKTISDQFLSNGELSSLVDEYLGIASGIASSVANYNSRCVYEIPSDFEPSKDVGNDPMGIYKLSCKGNGSQFFGYANDEWHFVNNNDNSSLFTFRASTDVAEIWSINHHYNESEDGPETGSSWSDYVAQYKVVRMLIDNVNQTKEFTIFGSRSALQDAYCGLQLKMKGDLIYTRGRFIAGECSNTFEDEDCLRVGSSGDVTREDLSVCYSPANADVTAFSFSMLSTSSFTKSDIETILSRVPADETPDYEAQTATAEAPAMDNDLSTWAKVSTLPLTISNERFTRGAKDNGPLSANCGHNSADQTRDISFSWSFDLGSLTAGELTSLNSSIASGDAYVGYNFVLPVTVLGGASTSSTVAATVKLKDSAGDVVKESSIADHEDGAYALSGFLTDPVNTDMTIEMDWSGTISLTCPDSPNSGDQASIRAYVKDLKLRFN